MCIQQHKILFTHKEKNNKIFTLLKPLTLAATKNKFGTSCLLLEKNAELKKVLDYQPFQKSGSESILKEVKEALEDPQKKVFTPKIAHKLQRCLSNVWEIMFQDCRLVRKEFRRAVEQQDNDALDILFPRVTDSVLMAVFGSDEPVQFEKFNLEMKTSCYIF